MSVLLTNQWRRRTAALMAALFALCLVAPVAAFAFGDSTAAAHCLTTADAPKATSESGGHQHGDISQAATTHEAMDHGAPAPSGGDDHALPGKCCGLYCVSALAPPAFGVADVQLVAASEVAMASATSLWGRSSSRIDRPPRVLTAL